MRNKFKNITEVWDAIDKGKTVYWSNTSYKLTIEDAIPKNDYQSKHFTNRKNKLLRVTCISNYFGSLLDASELTQLFTKE